MYTPSMPFVGRQTARYQRRLASQFLLAGEALDEGNGGGNAAAIRYFLSRLTEKERVKQAGGN